MYWELGHFDNFFLSIWDIFFRPINPFIKSPKEYITDGQNEIIKMSQFPIHLSWIVLCCNDNVLTLAQKYAHTRDYDNAYKGTTLHPLSLYHSLTNRTWYGKNYHKDQVRETRDACGRVLVTDPHAFLASHTWLLLLRFMAYQHSNH